MTFAIGYDDPNSELPYADMVAKYLGSGHYSYYISAITYRENLEKFVSSKKEL